MNRVHKTTERLTGAEVRRRLEEAVEVAIAALDAFEGDCDLEECGDHEPNTGDDEPYLGSHGAYSVDAEYDVAESGVCDWGEATDQTRLISATGSV